MANFTKDDHHHKSWPAYQLISQDMAKNMANIPKAGQHYDKPNKKWLASYKITNITRAGYHYG